MADEFFRIDWMTIDWRVAIEKYVRLTRQETSQVVEQRARRIIDGIRSRTPVASGRLYAGWQGPYKVKGRDVPTYRISNSVEYASVVEYGGYEATGPRTARLGPRDFGFDIVISGGIYSTQAPWGMVRRTLAVESRVLFRDLQAALRKHWGRR